jgi:hypothetical protein
VVSPPSESSSLSSSSSFSSPSFNILSKLALLKL